MRKHLGIWALSLAVSPFFAQAEVSTTVVRPEPDIAGAVHYADKELQNDSVYSSNFKMREERKIGIGTQIGGGLGMAGVNLEINVDAENAALAGVGTGTGYGTFQVLWKHSFEGKFFTPYTTAGWSRWYNSASTEDYKKSLILDRVLNDEQKSTGRFGVDFLTASVGLQYQQLSGEFAGLSFFGEFALLSAFRNLTPQPTGSLGATYFF